MPAHQSRLVYNEKGFAHRNRTMRYKKITSPSNPLVREILKEKKERTGGVLIVEGRRLIEMALTSGAGMGRVFFTEAFRSKNGALLMRLSKKSSELIETSGHVLSKLADTETPQGIVAEVFREGRSLQELSLQDSPLIVVCDSIRDPGNLGAIIRTADAAAADAVVLLPGTCDPFLPKGIRATAGSVFNLPVLFSEEAVLLEWLRKKSVGLAVSDVNASLSIFDADLSRPLAFVFGNEAAGVSGHLKGKSDMRVRIPMPGRAESLNVATAAAICLYEAVRQRSSHAPSAG
jgi:TrmH family RNA methyltransferase